MKEQHLFFTVNNNVYVGVVSVSHKKKQQVMDFTITIEHNKIEELYLSFKSGELQKTYSSTKMDAQLSDVVVKTLMSDPRFPDKFLEK